MPHTGSTSDRGAECLRDDGCRERTAPSDPIDGTANFLHGLPLCAVSLGLVEGDHTVLGVIELPFLGGTYSAVERKGAFRDDEPIQVSSTADIGAAMVSYGDYAVGENADAKNKVRIAIAERLAA